MKKDDIVYDERGNAYRLHETINERTHVVYPLYENPETGDGDEGEPEVVFCALHAEPPRQKVDAAIDKTKAELADLQRQVRETQDAARLLESECNERMKRLKQHQQLQLLDDFLAGKITHYVHQPSVWVPPEIIEFRESTSGEGHYKELRLLGLFGGSKGDLTWKLSNYSDGSGCYSTVTPCTSIKQAKAVWREAFYGFAEQALSDKPQWSPNETWLTRAAEYGIDIPDTEYRRAVERVKTETKARKIADLKTKLAELETK